MQKLEKQTNSQEMRFLLTQKCNYNCTFCHGEGLQSQKESFLTPDDYKFLFGVGLEYFNMQTCTFTGGEPLFRKDVVEIAELVKDEGGLITVTTNGSLLDKRIDLGKHIQQINISLHSLDSKKYEQVVGKKDMFKRVLTAIRVFREKYPEVNIILNTTIGRRFRYEFEDLANIINFANEVEASIKFIELFPNSVSDFVSIKETQVLLAELGFFPTNSESHRKVVLSNGPMSIALIRILCSQAMLSDNPSEFCYHNNDLFVSPDGTIKPCRENIREVNLFEAIKNRDRIETANKLKESKEFLGKNCIYRK